MRMMPSWNVVTSNDLGRGILQPAFLLNIIICFLSSFVFLLKSMRYTANYLLQPEHFPHFLECCDIGRSGLGHSWSGQATFLDDILICFLPSILISLSISSSPISLQKVFKLLNRFSIFIVSFSFPFYNTLCQDCRISWSSPYHSLMSQCAPQSVPSTLSYSFPDPPLPLSL